MIHAKLLGHSEFIVHSGLQFGGFPKNCGKHEHDGEPPMFLHCALGPQGDGTQGSLTGSMTGIGGGAKINNNSFCQ